MTSDMEIRAADFFCGAGGMVSGYESARAEIMGTQGRFKTVFAVDVWDVAARSCEAMTGVHVTVADLFTAEQYVQFHGEKACWCGSKQRLDECHQRTPPDWVEMQPEDLRRLCPGGVSVLKGSPPCKGFSRLLGNERASHPKYLALNELVVRWIWLWLEAFPESPPDLILMENVPDIADCRRKKQKRGTALVERVEAMLSSYGYATRRTAFDCGEIAGLAQHRDRFLLVARLVRTTQAPLLEPFKLPMKTIGDVIGDLPPPVGPCEIPMHFLTPMRRDTKRRLMYVTKGADWRSIERNWLSAPGWRIFGGVLVPTNEACDDFDPRIDRTAFNNVCRLAGFDEQSPCVTGGGGSANGNVADPRPAREYFGGIFGVQRMEDQADTVTGRASPSTGSYSVADARLPKRKARHKVKYSLGTLDGKAATVTGAYSIGAQGLADERIEDVRLADDRNRHNTKYSLAARGDVARTITGAAEQGIADEHVVEAPMLTCRPSGAALRVIGMDATSPTVTATPGVWSNGSIQLSDPRCLKTPRNGAFGVQDFDDQADTVTGSIDVHNGPAAVAAPPAGDQVLIAPDWALWHRTGKWRPSAMHRAFSMRELADLQSVPRFNHKGKPVHIAGTADEQRMQIGNMVPPEAGRVIAELMIATILASRLGVPVSGGSGIWVRERGVLWWHASSRGQESMLGEDLGT